MNIEIGLEHSNPIDIGFTTVTKTWMDFIKIHLWSPHKNGIALLKAKQTFMMNLRLHLKGDILRNNYTHTIFQ